MTGGYYGAYGSTITGYYAEFPYPPEVNGGSNRLEYYSYREQTDMFPPPLEVTGGSYKDVAVPVLIGVTSFPYPSEVNGGSYLLTKN